MSKAMAVNSTKSMLRIIEENIGNELNFVLSTLMKVSGNFFILDNIIFASLCQFDFTRSGLQLFHQHK